MNEEVEWRLEFGRQLSEKLTAFQGSGGIRASAIGGSVARGFSDTYSDIELILLWENTPDHATRQAVRTALAAEHRYPVFDPAYDHAVRVQGVPVDLWHLTIATEEATIRQVLEENSLDLVANNRLDTFRHCTAFSGWELLDGWKARIEQYPDALAMRFLKEYLPHFHLRQLNLVVRRDNPTVYFHMLTDIQCSLYIVLLALNREYFPTFKWLYPVLETLKIQPAETAARLRRMFTAPPLEAAGQLRDLLAETLNLVEERFPQMDTTFARYGLDQPALSFTPPPGTTITGPQQSSNP